MTSYDFIDNRFKLALFGFIYNVGVVNPYHRLVCRDNYNVQLVYLPEFVFLGGGCTGHTGKLFIKSEIVLEGDGCNRLGFVCNLYPLFCLYRLMKSGVIPSAVHKSSGELINNNDLAVFNNVVNILFHNAVGFDRLIYMVQQGDVVGVHKVFHAEICLRSGNARLCKSGCLCLFVNDIVAAVDSVGILLGLQLNNNVLFKRLCKPVRLHIHIRGFLALTRYDKGSSCLVDKDRVHLVHNGESMTALNLVLFVYNPVVAQVVESELVVCAVGDIAVIGFAALGIVLGVKYYADGKSQKSVDPAHLLRLEFCKIVVYGYNMNSLARKGVEV